MSDTLTGKLAIVMVNYASHALVSESLRQVGDLGATVVIVDNFSSASEARTIRQLTAAHGWELVSSDKNLGFGGGMNLGVGRALSLGCDAILLLNPDMVISSSTVKALYHAVLREPMTMVTPALDYANGRLGFAGGQIDLTNGVTTSRPDHVQQGDSRWLSGACLVVHRTMWLRLGGFDPAYFMYWEDIDLSQRCLRESGELRVEHRLRAVHHVGGTQVVGGKSALYCYYNCRNRLLFAQRNLSPSIQTRWLLTAPRYAIRVVRRSRPRYILRHPDIVVAAFLGTFVGMAKTIWRLVWLRASAEIA